MAMPAIRVLLIITKRLRVIGDFSGSSSDSRCAPTHTTVSPEVASVEGECMTYGSFIDICCTHHYSIKPTDSVVILTQINFNKESW